MKRLRYILPLTAAVSIMIGCSTTPHIARVRISQPKSNEKIDTTYKMPKEIRWTDDKGVEHIVTEAEKDTASGEYITVVELSAITVVAKSKQVAERNGMIDLDFLVTVPGELISNKWQVQLTPVAYKPADTIYLDKIFLSGADFLKMQKKGYMRYQAFMNSIIPDSLYLQKLFDKKGYNRTIADLENEYYQAWKRELLSKEQWIDWSDKINRRFMLFNGKTERNMRSIEGTNTILKYLPAYWMMRELSGEYVPGKWRMFADGNHKIRMRTITAEDSAAIADRYMDYDRIAENQRRKEMAGAMFKKYVRFPYQPARLDTVINDGKNFVYYYKQQLPATENMKKVDLTLNGQIVSKDESITQLPPSDTLTYFISSMVQFLDRTPRYKKKIITRKDEMNLRAYINFGVGKTNFDETLGNNKEEIDKVYKMIHGINFTGEFLIDSIRMSATSSPEGGYRMNSQLAKQRSINLKKYLISKSDDPEGVDSLFMPRWTGEDWERLETLVAADDTLMNKAALLDIIRGTDDPDSRELKMRKYKEDYKRIRTVIYPELRGVEFKFHVHRRNMLQDTIVMPVIDSTYMDAVKMIEDRQYSKALEVLDNEYPNDFNTAICLMSLGYDARALGIMLEQEDSSERNYLCAILYSRLGKEKEAVRSFMRACEQDEMKIYRGKLDPEINKLIKTYNLFKDEY